MKLIVSHNGLIAWYENKLGLSDYGLLWLVFFKGVLIALVCKRVNLH